MSPLDFLVLVPILLTIVSGGTLSVANLATIGTLIQKVLTPANIEAALAFMKKHGPEVQAVIADGALWLKHHNETHKVLDIPAGWMEAAGELYPIAVEGPPLDPNDPVYKAG